MMITKVYLHSDRDTMYEIGEELGLTGKELENFSYSCYEVEITLKVDPKTGNAEIFQIDGRNVE